MAKASADQILEALEFAVKSAADTMTTADRVAARDGFIPVELLAEVESVEAERVFAIALLEGPYAIPGRSQCRDELLADITIRYFYKRGSRARMLRDVPRLRQKLRAISSAQIGTPLATVPGDPSCDVEGPRYDYSTFADVGWVLMRLTAKVSYEAEVT